MKVFIDAGHNDAKVDTGATGNGLREQDITYHISKQLGKKLKLVGFDVIYSRNNIDDIIGTSISSSLNKRATMANNSGADLFLSIHCNAYYLKSANGTETYVYNKNSKVYDLAKNISKRISNDLEIKNRGTKTASFVVLKKTTMPAILIETAFITNKTDAEKLKNRQDDFVSAIYEEICNYYNIGKKQTEEEPLPDKPEPYKYHIEGSTHIIEVDPRNIWCVETQEKTDQTPYNNFVNSVFFMNQENGIMHPQGIMVNAGKVICNNQTHGKPVATLIVYGKDDVQLKYIDDITKEKNVWFAVSGFGIYPELTYTQEGFVGKFGDVIRQTDRPIIGYRKKDNKIVIAVRGASTAQRSYQTAKNLGLDFAISLDGGGSTTLKVDGKYKFKGDGRKLFGGIIWS
jgi:hypothetical protein